MYRNDIKHLLTALAAIAVTVLISLWSWNTLAELFGAPQAQFRHVVAVVLLLAMLRFATGRRHGAIRHHPHP